MKKYISFVLIAVLFAACTPNNEVGTPFKAGQEVSITAHMPNAGANHLPGKQRISGKDVGTQIDLTWDTGDEIKVIVGDKSDTFTLASGAGSAQATFTGTMPADGVTYSVQYPIADPDLSLQTYVKDGFGKGLLKMVADDGTIDDGFVLKAQHALLGLQLTGSDALGKIVLTNPANSKTYTLDCAGVTLTNEATLFYIVVPAGEWADGFTVDIYADDNSTIIKTLTKNSSATFSATEAMIMPEHEVGSYIYQGIGVFSVAEGKTVTFSPGNLQYHPANNEWRFAPSQLDYIGNANENISPTYNGWLDLFGWSGNTGSAKFGVSTSTDDNDYSGSFVDWGTNQIGADAPNTWRTLSKDEWEYLINARSNASSLQGVAQVNGVNGLILLPDSWTCPSGVTFKSGFHSYSVEVVYGQHQTFTADQWSKLEAAGAVFLPAAGIRIGADTYSEQYFGRYWSATEYSEMCPYNFRIFADRAHLDNRDYRDSGHSVRLVKDVTTNETPDIPEEPTTPSTGIGVFSVAGGKTVTFSPGNLQYTQSTDTWSFAENQWDMIGTDNVIGGSVESDPTRGDSKEGTALAEKIDLFGWSTSATNFGVSTSTDDNDYLGSFVDWGTNQIGADAPNTWRTLTLEEWYYVVFNRSNADNLKGIAQVNSVNGFILLPDNWTCPNGIIFKSGFHSDNNVEAYGQYQSFTADQWSKLEAAGAVFLPAAGGRYGTRVSIVQAYCIPWSATATEGTATGAYCFHFEADYADPYPYIRCCGQSVRLVKDL